LNRSRSRSRLRSRFRSRCRPGLAFALLTLTFIAPSCTGAQVSNPADPAVRPLPVDRIRLPEGFRVSVFSDGVPGARELARGADGTIFVGTRTTGTVFAVRDDDEDGAADRVFAIATGLNSPNGVAFREGSLYVAEIHRILRFDEIETHLAQPPEPVIVRDDLPTEGWHGWKFIAFGPDDRLYVPIGAPCNVCEVAGDRFAAIHRMNPDGSGFETFARGVRNTVGFDWHPTTGELWFTDNGRDYLGDDLPPCELNHAPSPGLHFGFPYCHGRGIHDPEFGTDADCAEFVAPARELGAHVAPLGMRFYTGSSFPETYRGQILIAEHGSWNRSRPAGYRVMLVSLDGDRAISYETFADGWLSDDGAEAWGRPVDVLVLPDGSVLVSDDRAGAIYRITYGG
jgi:glucose/arabinose dehydrogenase